jgi:hypothetical protein
MNVSSPKTQASAPIPQATKKRLTGATSPAQPDAAGEQLTPEAAARELAELLSPGMRRWLQNAATRPPGEYAQEVRDLCLRARDQAATMIDLFAQFEPYYSAGDCVARSQQLAFISRAVQQLERREIPIPEHLSLAHAALRERVAIDQVIAEFFGTVATTMSGLIGAHAKFLHDQGQKPSRPYIRLPRTPAKVLGATLVEALQDLGGTAGSRDVLNKVASKLAGKWLPGDLRKVSNKNVYWRQTARLRAKILMKQGILRRGRHYSEWKLGPKAPTAAD